MSTYEVSVSRVFHDCVEVGTLPFIGDRDSAKKFVEDTVQKYSEAEDHFWSPIVSKDSSPNHKGKEEYVSSTDEYLTWGDVDTYMVQA